MNKRVTSATIARRSGRLLNALRQNRFLLAAAGQAVADLAGHDSGQAALEAACHL